MRRLAQLTFNDSDPVAQDDMRTLAAFVLVVLVAFVVAIGAAHVAESRSACGSVGACDAWGTPVDKGPFGKSLRHYRAELEVTGSSAEASA